MLLLLLIGVPENSEFNKFIENFNVLTAEIEKEIKLLKSTRLLSTFQDFKLELRNELQNAPLIQEANVPYFKVLEKEVKFANRLLDYLKIPSLSKKVFDVFKTALSSIIDFSSETLGLLWKLMDEMVDLGRIFEKN